MTTTPTVLGVITARSGSKGIPRKNVAMLGGRPLISYTIDAARNSSLLTRWIVSTDDPEIADIARSAGADVPFLRPASLSTDAALALDVLNHALTELEKEGAHFDYVMMLQPTSPLRTGDDIDACIRLAASHDADSVFSMRELPDFAPQKIKTVDADGWIHPFLEEEKGQSAPRHKGKRAFKRNCAVYLTKTALIRKGDQFGKRSMAYVMPEERSVDVNGPVDLELAEFFLQRSATR